MTSPAPAPKSRFLVLHDYGMGGAWWWVHARSAREVLETFAEVEVVDSPDVIRRADLDLPDVDIDEPTMPPGLDGLRAKRDAQRNRPGSAIVPSRAGDLPSPVSGTSTGRTKHRAAHVLADPPPGPLQSDRMAFIAAAILTPEHQCC